MQSIWIEKGDGEKELFNEEKLINSLKKNNVSDKDIHKILLEVNETIHPNISSNQIFKTAYSVLKEIKKDAAIRYSLRRSVLDMGPTGFPFEILLGKVFQKKGYNVQIGHTLQGSCIDHEIDVMAYNKTELIFVEAKFHNDLRTKSDTKTALYVKARYDDLKSLKFNIESKDLKPTDMFIVTNTKFTHNAIKYANCVGLKLVSWNYPEQGNLYSMIEDYNIFPVTVLDSLTQKQKKFLISKKIVDCIELKENIQELKNFNFSEKKINQVLQEVETVCSIEK